MLHDKYQLNDKILNELFGQTRTYKVHEIPKELLEEINCRIHARVSRTVFEKVKERHILVPSITYHTFDGSLEYSSVYTENRAAIKAIRPENWVLEHINLEFDGSYVALFSKNDDLIIGNVMMPTEELAELYSIMLVMDYIETNVI